jgi:hypothetical protein
MDEKWYEFNPQSNINVYELAQILQTLMMIRINDDLKSKLPKYADRHFQEVRDDQDLRS